MSSQPRVGPAQLSRATEGRWLGGVCAGLAPIRGLGVGWMRVGFVLLALLGGLGIGLYLACWLIIPAGDVDAGDNAGAQPPSGVIALAQAGAACVGLAALAVLAGVATLFGFGWIVVVVGAVVLAVVLIKRGSLRPGWALLPIAALTVPAVAVATRGLKLAPQAGAIVVAPLSSAELKSSTYRSGLGAMTIDLRHTSFPAAGVVPLRIDAGVRRTIIALPSDRCVRVNVRYDVNPLVVRLGALMTGRSTPPFSDVDVFGRLYATKTGDVTDGGAGSYPILMVDFSSQGGSLYVRDYPNTVNPDARPDWPGYAVTPEPHPFLRGEPRKVRQQMVRAWRQRRRLELQSKNQIDALMPGPCG